MFNHKKGFCCLKHWLNDQWHRCYFLLYDTGLLHYTVLVLFDLVVYRKKTCMESWKSLKIGNKLICKASMSHMYEHPPI